MGAIAKVTAQVTEGKADEYLAGADVESFALNSGKDFNQPRLGGFGGFRGHVAKSVRASKSLTLYSLSVSLYQSIVCLECLN
jgi:hypothetical protein